MSKKLTHSLHNPQAHFDAFKQGSQMSNATNQHKFNGLVNMCEHLGGEFGSECSHVHAELIAADVANSDNLMDEKLKAAKGHAHKEYLAVQLLCKSDLKHYG